MNLVEEIVKTRIEKKEERIMLMKMLHAILQ